MKAILLLCTVSAVLTCGVAAVDGDTIRISVDAIAVSIRLYGIDCPETDQAYGEEAAAFTQKLLDAGALDGRIIATDRYRRVIMIVEAGGKCINEELVAAGLAWVEPRYCTRAECETWKALESEARLEGRGLWADVDPVPPWTYRKIH